MSGPCGRTSVPIIREVEEISTVNMVKTIKKIYPSCVILVKVGNFYHVYGKDAYIFSYLFEYKILEKEGVPSYGFPINAISKVENILERTKINYVSVDRRNNYDEEEKYVDKQKNNYEKTFEKSKQTIDILLRIQKITDFLKQYKENENIEKILEEMEKIISDERREI